MAIIECKDGVELLSTAHMKDLFEMKIGPLPPVMPQAEEGLITNLRHERDIFCAAVCRKEGACQAKKYGSDAVAQFLANQAAVSILQKLLERRRGTSGPAHPTGGAV